uniref:Putative GRF zinc finger n=1 Tax=Davidia involucrata TaxID=16924 RepID=A0A5B7A236_DAVIN
MSTHVQDIQVPFCACGAGYMRVLTSHTDENPDRLFYRCPLGGQHRHAFFWVDEYHAYIGDRRRNVAARPKITTQRSGLLCACCFCNILLCVVVMFLIFLIIIH